MKRKFATLAAFAVLTFGHCSQPCFDPRPDYCGIDGRRGTVAIIDHRPRVILFK